MSVTIPVPTNPDGSIDWAGLLRNTAAAMPCDPATVAQIMREAADQIDRLTAEITDWRSASAYGSHPAPGPSFTPARLIDTLAAFMDERDDLRRKLVDAEALGRRLAEAAGRVVREAEQDALSRFIVPEDALGDLALLLSDEDEPALTPAETARPAEDGTTEDDYAVLRRAFQDMAAEDPDPLISAGADLERHTEATVRLDDATGGTKELADRCAAEVARGEVGHG